MEIYTVEQAAKILSVSTVTMRLWLRDGVIKGHKIGGGHLWRITGDAIREFVQSGETA